MQKEGETNKKLDTSKELLWAFCLLFPIGLNIAFRIRSSNDRVFLSDLIDKYDPSLRLADLVKNIEDEVSKPGNELFKNAWEKVTPLLPIDLYDLAAEEFLLAKDYKNSKKFFKLSKERRPFYQPLFPKIQLIYNAQEQDLLEKKPAFQIKDNNQPHTAYEILASKTFCQNDEQCQTVLETYKDLYFDEELKPILNIAAMQTLNKEEFHIAMLNDGDTEDYAGGKSIGFYDYKKVVVGNGYGNSKIIQGTFIHEISHAIIDYLFNNWSNPYKQDQKALIDAMENTNMQVLKNLANLKQLPSNFKLENYEESYLLGENLMKVYSNAPYKADIPYKLRHEYNYISAVIFNVYDKDCYPYIGVTEDVETIVRYHQLKVEGVSSQALEVLKPYKEYWNKYLFPEIEKTLQSNHNRQLLRTPSNEDLLAYYLSIGVFDESKLPVIEKLLAEKIDLSLHPEIVSKWIALNNIKVDQLFLNNLNNFILPKESISQKFYFIQNIFSKLSQLLDDEKIKRYISKGMDIDKPDNHGARLILESIRKFIEREKYNYDMGLRFDTYHYKYIEEIKNFIESGVDSHIKKLEENTPAKQENKSIDVAKNETTLIDNVITNLKLITSLYNATPLLSASPNNALKQIEVGNTVTDVALNITDSCLALAQNPQVIQQQAMLVQVGYYALSKATTGIKNWFNGIPTSTPVEALTKEKLFYKTTKLENQLQELETELFTVQKVERFLSTYDKEMLKIAKEQIENYSMDLKELKESKSLTKAEVKELKEDIKHAKSNLTNIKIKHIIDQVKDKPTKNIGITLTKLNKLENSIARFIEENDLSQDLKKELKQEQKEIKEILSSYTENIEKTESQNELSELKKETSNLFKKLMDTSTKINNSMDLVHNKKSFINTVKELKEEIRSLHKDILSPMREQIKAKGKEKGNFR
jgi:hypothetical protein